MATENTTAGTKAPGIFISFEGGEGAGKSTHINFLAEALEAHGSEVVRLREPGGTAIGEKLRTIVLDIGNAEMSDAAELFIYEAARAQVVEEAIRPALARGAVVLIDRFCDSTLAYQAFGRGLDRGFVERANAFATGGLTPDRTLVMTCGPSASTGLERATKNGTTDRLESAGEAFHGRVNAAFMRLAAEDPGRIRVIESAHRKSETAHAVFTALADLFPWVPGLLADAAFFERVDVGSYGNKHLEEG